ncbi:hypothetical protein D3C74_56960 [compost metagenome]
MKYWIGKPEHSIVHPAIPVWDEEANGEDLGLADWTQWPESSAAQFRVRGHDLTVYPDLILGELLLVSDSVHELLHVYMPQLFSRMALLRDLDRMEQRLYWLVQPPLVDGIGEGTEWQLGGRLQKLVVNQQGMQQQPLARLRGLREPYLVVELALAESMLRRGYIGMQLEEAELQ